MILGIAALDRKCRSKPMTTILRLLRQMRPDLEICIFGDQTLFSMDITDWPVVDVLVSFFSTGFPISKAESYIELRKPVLVNDLSSQRLLFDRRAVLTILDHIGVPTLERIIIEPEQVRADEASPSATPSTTATNTPRTSVDGHNDDDLTPMAEKLNMKDYDRASRTQSVLDDPLSVHGPIQLPHHLNDSFKQQGLDIEAQRLKMTFQGHMAADNGAIVYGSEPKVFLKPFVEKPISAEDHNINVYFRHSGRKLFRKVGNKSSEADPNLLSIRTDRSYIYEKFLEVDNAEDVKVYSVGPNQCHAETRKSPVIDGVVKRNEDGKEIRYIVELTPAEKEMARKITKAFKQNICGFDLVRANGKSYVIDVNGWSFVKGNEDYYHKMAAYLATFFLVDTRLRSTPSAAWNLKCQVICLRHADRTPKRKFKLSLISQDAFSRPFFDLLQGHEKEIILRTQAHFDLVLNATQQSEALSPPEAEAKKLHVLRQIIEKTRGLEGTKIQLKPGLDSNGQVEKLTVIHKFGGNSTHSAGFQMTDLGQQLRSECLVVKPDLIEKCNIFTSSEARVYASAQTFAESFAPNIEHKEIHIRKDLLDDNSAAKNATNDVKKALKELLRNPDAVPNTKEVNWPENLGRPAEVVIQVMSLMEFFQKVVDDNYAACDPYKVQSKWCCEELPELFKERWNELFAAFTDTTSEKFDPGRVSELYDTIKFDALHNHTFLMAMFAHSRTELVDGMKPTLHALYERVKALFALVAPAEYGITAEERLNIGLLTSLPLLKQVVADLQTARNAGPCMSMYWTKESHMHTLVQLVLLSGLARTMPYIPELDYGSHISFELFERVADSRQYSIRLAISPGSHTEHILDLALDAKHALMPRKREYLTANIPYDEAIAAFSQHFDRAVDSSTTPLEAAEVWR